MGLQDFDQARAIQEALVKVFARERGGTADRGTLAFVTKLCDAAVDAVNDLDCRVAIRGVKSLAILLYSDNGWENVDAGELHGAEAVRFQILNTLASYRGRLDVLQNRPPSRPDLPVIEHKKQLRILVIEDNWDSANTLKKLLEICGYDVTVAYTALDGLEAARRVRPDVVLCDIGLPDTDGFTLGSVLRREPATASARLIAVTAYSTEADLVRSKSAGFQLHLVKPVNPQFLLDQVEGKQEQPQSIDGQRRQ